jgi:hypothetical protein
VVYLLRIPNGISPESPRVAAWRVAKVVGAVGSPLGRAGQGEGWGTGYSGGADAGGWGVKGPGKRQSVPFI